MEFTSTNSPTNQTSDEDDLLVFYVKENQLDQIKQNIQSKGISTLKATNPYWNENGIYFKDPDGFGVMVTLERS